ncbi:peptidase S8/S53 domain-containing protein [Ilyonectria sp. MPI-CAGE-AT-0026]|nr:peptidase S8/S53 domain-containing protein [Ilyonectria sp. MPI-CAGE-AT-0026]
MLQEHTCLKDPEDFPNEEFSLPTLLLAISRTETGKVVLGMQLAHALTYLYDGGWLTGRWQERNFSLFGRGGKVPCKPWLKVSLPQQPRPQTIKQPRFHRFPQILELGIILLELQIGEGLESSLGEQPTEDLDQRWAMATTKFMMMEKHILSDDYRRALAFCLKPGASLSAEAVKQPELVRQAIHDNVVVPLESAITRSKIGHDIFESLDLRDTMSSSPPSTLDQLLPQEGTRPSPSEDIRHQTTTTPASQVVQPDEKNTATEIEKDFELFGSEQELQPNQEQSRVSDDWIKGFKQIVKDKLKGEKARQNELRVKIAVLDTGIDLKHMDFRGEYKDGRIKSVRSWVDGADGMEDSEAGDSSGHGTFIASLLLDLGPPIDLYVARVSKSKNFKQGTSENIANALHYARTEWKVDIITMSFGYPCGVARIKSEITQAVQSNILVFAAASNDGGNRSRMFPARQLLVFAIHSTSGHGNMSNFNPDPKRDENFSILGEYIEAAWLTTGGSASTRRLSGTSFATPIAACLAAFMLVYVPCILPEYQNLHHCLKSYEGMRNVLQLMANERTTAGGLAYQYLSPQLYFGENTLAGITASIEKALSF